MKTPMLIGTGLHILNPTFQKALEDKDRALLLDMAEERIENGAQGLDINPGPARHFQKRLPWLVRTLQAHRPIPLFLPMCPTLEESLSLHRGPAFINAVTGEPRQLEQGLRLARQYRANLVVLLTRPACLQAASETRLRVALEALDRAEALAVPPERLYLDPLLSLRPDPRAWRLDGGMPDLEPVLETIALLDELSRGRSRTILALDPTGPRLDPGQRSAIRRRVLALLARAGLDAVFLDTRDQELVRVARSPEAWFNGRLKAA